MSCTPTVTSYAFSAVTSRLSPGRYSGPQIFGSGPTVSAETRQPSTVIVPTPPAARRT